MATSDLRTTPRQPRSAETIEIILDAAEAVFAAKGLDNGTTSDIAHEAGISVGRVYYWFESKDAIVEGLVARSSRLISECFADVIATRDDHERYSSAERILRSTIELARRSPAVKLVLEGHSEGVLKGHRDLRAQFVASSAQTYVEHFVGTSLAEAVLVAEASVSLSWGSISRLIDEDGDDLLREVVYASTAYLTCRFPPDDRPVHSVVGSARTGYYEAGVPSKPLQPVTYPDVDLTDSSAAYADDSRPGLTSAETQR